MSMQIPLPITAEGYLVALRNACADAPGISSIVSFNAQAMLVILDQLLQKEYGRINGIRPPVRASVETPLAPGTTPPAPPDTEHE